MARDSPAMLSQALWTFPTSGRRLPDAPTESRNLEESFAVAILSHCKILHLDNLCTPK